MSLNDFIKHKILIHYGVQTSAKCVLGGVLGQPQELEREDPGDGILGPFLLTPYLLDSPALRIMSHEKSLKTTAVRY